MLPCVCSVIDHRWRQNVVKTEKWHMSHRRVSHMFFSTFWRRLLSITKKTHVNIKSIRFLQKTERENDKRTSTCLSVRGFVPGWAFFKSSRTLFFSLLLLFSLSYLYTVSPSKNFNAFPCSKHNNRKNMRVSRRDDTRWQLLCGRGGRKTIEMWRWWWYITSLLTELCWHKSWVWGRWGLDVGSM